MVTVFMLFPLPCGGGIPAGVLLAQAKGLAWPLTAGHQLLSAAIPGLTMENDPASLLQGRDPQLEVGIATLLKQLKDNPTPTFRRCRPTRSGDPGLKLGPFRTRDAWQCSQGDLALRPGNPPWPSIPWGDRKSVV